MIDLKNSSNVKQQLNLTLDDIWEEFLWLRYAPPYDIIRCVSISVPTIKSDVSEAQGGPRQFTAVNLIFEHSKFTRLFLEFKGKGQSKMNYDPGKKLKSLLNVPKV